MAYLLKHAVPFRERALDCHGIRQQMVRPMSPPRKRHRAINRDKPKADDFPADISPLSFSPEGEMQVTLVLSKTGWCGLLWFCERLVDADYSGSVKDWLMQVTLVL